MLLFIFKDPMICITSLIEVNFLNCLILLFDIWWVSMSYSKLRKKIKTNSGYNKKSAIFFTCTRFSTFKSHIFYIRTQVPKY